MIDKAFENKPEKEESVAGNIVPANIEDQQYADLFGLLSIQLSDITTSSLAIINLLKQEIVELQDSKLLRKLEVLLDKNVSSLLKPMSIIHQVVKPDMFFVDLIDVLEEFVQFLRVDQQIKFELVVPDSSIYIKSNKMIHDLLKAIVDIVHSIFCKEHLSVYCKVHLENSTMVKIDIGINGNYKKEIKDRMQKNLIVEECLTTDIKILFKLLVLLVNAHGGICTKEFGVDSLALSIDFPIVEKT